MEISPNRNFLNNPIEIRSSNEELVLRQFSPKDSEEIFTLIGRNRGHLSQFGDDTANKYPTLETVRESIEHPRNPNRLRFAIRNMQKELVGSVNLTPDENDPTQAEIGYYLGSEFQGKGYMGKAVEILTNYGFDFLNYRSIYGDVAEGNISSVNVLLKSGYREIGKHDGKIRYSKNHRS